MTSWGNQEIDSPIRGRAWTKARPNEAGKEGAEVPRYRMRVFDMLIGQRFIDLPIRVLAVIVAVSAVTPGSVEGREPGYLALFYISSALLIVSSFVPTTAAMIIACLFVVHMLAYPGYLNPFQDNLVFATAVLLSRGWWRQATAVIVATFVLAGVAQHVQPGVAMSFGELAFSLGLSSALALSAWLLERRIREEIVRREGAAVTHVQDVQRLRIGFAVDTHDTISHGLATQAAVLKVLSYEQVEPEVRRRLGELAMLNDQTQQSLRTLLRRLRNAQTSAPATPAPRDDLLQALDSLVAAADAGGYIIETQIDLPESLSPELAEYVLLVSRELVTNIVKHSSSRHDCVIDIGTVDHDLVIRARNPVVDESYSVPLSLSERVTSIGGDFRVHQAGGRFTVTIRLPSS